MTQRPALAAAIAISLVVAISHAQSSLPAPPPTQQPTAVGPIAGTTDVGLVKQTHGHRADVTFGDGRLQVRANNSSLNVILRQIAAVTGMTITGGVKDDRVFGNYGPADPGTVIATLLSGTGVNIFVRMDETDAPAQLILTARTGGATPPAPNSSQYDEEARAEAQELSAEPVSPQPRPMPLMNTTLVPNPNPSPVSTPSQIAPPPNNVNGNSANQTPTASQIPTVQSVSTSSLPTPSTTPSSTGIVDTPNQPAYGATPAPTGNNITGATTTTSAGTNSAQSVTTAPDGTTTTTTVTSPTGVKTPDQIYQQLLKIQQAQQKAAGGSSTTTTSPQ